MIAGIKLGYITADDVNKYSFIEASPNMRVFLDSYFEDN